MFKRLKLCLVLIVIFGAGCAARFSNSQGENVIGLARVRCETADQHRGFSNHRSSSETFGLTINAGPSYGIVLGYDNFQQLKIPGLHSRPCEGQKSSAIPLIKGWALGFQRTCRVQSRGRASWNSQDLAGVWIGRNACTSGQFGVGSSSAQMTCIDSESDFITLEGMRSSRVVPFDVFGMKVEAPLEQDQYE